jgi:large subunit ribosomal protein L19
MKQIINFVKSFKKEIPDVRAGDEVRVFQKIKVGEKEKTQIFEGMVIAKKHGKEMGATITVRREISGIGVERIFPLHLPTIEKIEILKRGKVRRAKLYYLRKARGKRAKIKSKTFTGITALGKKEVEK